MSDSSKVQPRLLRSRTKTIATIGPACRQLDSLVDLIQCGVDIFRINMAHGSRSEHNQAVADIRRAAAMTGITVGILIDLSGPKIRLGELKDDPTLCPQGAEMTFVRGETATGPGQLVSSYPQLIDELSAGDHVLLADGTVSLEVIGTTAEAARCRVVAGGKVRNRQGINLPGVKLSVPAMTEEDRDNAEWAAETGIDFIGLSFVRSPDDIRELKQLVSAHQATPLIVAKIEKAEALDELDEIVRTADAVMVARGDLGVEIDVAEIAVAQKMIIGACQRFSKPVIVATQMLDSMQHSPRPTRAEATDVANAILDGADACMLSGETAIGEYPREAVMMMNRIMVNTEELLEARELIAPPAAATAGVHPVTSAVVYGAATIASRLAARLVVVATRSGATARVKAKQRDFALTIGVSNSEATLRRMCLFWGIVPLAGAPVDDPVALRRFVVDWGRGQELLHSGDRVVFVTGTGLVQGAHNSVVVHEVA